MELKFVNTSYFKQYFQNLWPKLFFIFSKNIIFVTSHFGTLLASSCTNIISISTSFYDLHRKLTFCVSGFPLNLDLSLRPIDPEYIVYRQMLEFYVILTLQIIFKNSFSKKEFITFLNICNCRSVLIRKDNMKIVNVQLQREQCLILGTHR